MARSTAQLNVSLPRDLVDQVKAAAAYTDTEGRGGALSRFVGDALRRRLKALIRARGGEPFPPIAGTMPFGRPRND